MKDEYTDYGNRLAIIANCRLLFNTKEALGSYIGFSLKGNSISKIRSTFQRKAIYAQLTHEFDEAFGNAGALNDVVTHYDRASRFYADTFKSFLRGHERERLMRLLDYRYGKAELSDDERERAVWSAIYNKVEDKERVNVPLLLLLSLHIIPTSLSREGDVEDLEGDAMRLAAFLEDFCVQHSHFTSFPIIQEMVSELRDSKDSEGISLYCRAHLIAETTEIMERYKSLRTPAGTQQVIEAITLSDKLLDLEGYWQKEQEPGTEFWQVTHTDNNNFFLFHCQYNSQERSVHFTRYYLAFYNDRRTCAVFAPEFTKETIETGRMNMDLSALYDATMEDDIDDDACPSRITFQKIVGNEHFLPALSLVRVEDNDTTEQLNTIWNQWTWIDNSPDAFYTFRASITAITHTHLYLQFDGGYFKIPYDKNPEFENPGLNDKIGIVSLNNKRYIAYDERGVYLNATDVQRLKDERGIEVIAKLEL